MDEGFQIGLGGIGTPFGDGGGIFAELCRQPFAGTFFLDQYYFESVDVFGRHNSYEFES